jgi:hypothetical protein
MAIRPKGAQNRTAHRAESIAHSWRIAIQGAELTLDYRDIQNQQVFLETFRAAAGGKLERIIRASATARLIDEASRALGYN